MTMNQVAPKSESASVRARVRACYSTDEDVIICLFKLCRDLSLQLRLVLSQVIVNIQKAAYWAIQLEMSSTSFICVYAERQEWT